MRATWLAVVCAVVSALNAACGSGGSPVDQAGSEAVTASGGNTRRTRRPPAPAGLTATFSGGTVLLSWTLAANATGYNVYRATSSAGTYTTLTASPQPATTYTDGAVT